VKHKGSPKVEIIATGDELIYGRVLDTNSNWLSKRLAEIGAELRRVTMVGDDYEDIDDVLHGALHRDSEIILFTGGLGPSEDDFTVDAIGRAIGLNVVLDQTTLDKIMGIYTRRGTADTASIARGNRMARVLEGSKPLSNPVGMSVGMMLEHEGKLIFTMPGVPAEVLGIFNEHVAHVIEAKSTQKLVGRTFNVTMAWKDFFVLYRQLQAEFPEIYIKNAATPPSKEDEDRSMVRTIKVDIVVQDETREKAERKMNDFVELYQKRIDATSGGTICSA
jgi:molybdenum cofactor synthesis domain-containing protein